MTARERVLLLLCCETGDGRTPLSLYRLGLLKKRLEAAGADLAELTAEQVSALGFAPDAQCQLQALLSRGNELDSYLRSGRDFGFSPVTEQSRDYPAELRQRLGERAPAVLFAKGRTELLGKKKIGSVGSRQLTAAGESFAREAGRYAASHGNVLVSGNADGADSVSQRSCLEAGGDVIAVLAGNPVLCADPGGHMLYLSESGWHLPFSAPRALARNRIIHALPGFVLVTQCRAGKGGTWNGTTENLRRGFCPVYVHRDGSDGAALLEQAGAVSVDEEDLRSGALPVPPQTAFL